MAIYQKGFAEAATDEYVRALKILKERRDEAMTQKRLIDADELLKWIADIIIEPAISDSDKVRNDTLAVVRNHINGKTITNKPTPTDNDAISRAALLQRFENCGTVGGSALKCIIEKFPAVSVASDQFRDATKKVEQPTLESLIAELEMPAQYEWKALPGLKAILNRIVAELRNNKGGS